MTQKEKIEELKSTISYLYENEGKSKNYISKLLNVDRKTLGLKINEWCLKQANIKKLTPSNQKFANKHKNFICSQFSQNVSLKKVADKLKVSVDYLRNIVEKEPTLKEAYTLMIQRKKDLQVKNINTLKEKSSRNYNIENLPDEEWKEILGFEDYFISNKGRIKKLAKRYNSYFLIKQFPNIKNGRLYASLTKDRKTKNLQVARLVAHAFVDGYSEINNTVNHKDNDISNNNADNLEWISQSENNYKKQNKKTKKRREFSKIIVDDKFEFKTVNAFAKFMNVSVTQAGRYLDGGCKCKRKITVE